MGLGALPFLFGVEHGEDRENWNNTSPAASEDKTEPVYLPGPVPGFRGTSKKIVSF